MGTRSHQESGSAGHRFPPLSRALALLWALSGFSVLTLETVWMREIALRAGNTAVASTLVIAVFFAAAAFGNLLGAQCVAGRPHALRFYGCFETAAAIFAAGLFALNRWLWTQGAVFPEGWAGPVAAAVLLVGLPSFLSGASFPCLAETFVEDADHRTATGGLFYGMNLLGAGLGVAAGGVWLPWHLGTHGAFCVAVAVQLAGGLLAWRIAAPVVHMPKPAASVAAPETLPGWLGWALLAASGLLSLAAQTLLIVWVRQVLEGSLYAVCGVLATFLFGLGIGGLFAAALRRKGYHASGLLMFFSGAAALLLALVPVEGRWLCAREILLTAATPSGLFIQALAGCAAVLLPLTFCLGGVFPVAWELVQTRSSSEGRVLGAAMALNKLGAAAGTALGLFALLPLFGLTHGTVLIAWGYLAVACLPALLARRLSGGRAVGLALVVGLCLWQTVRPEPTLGIAADERVLSSSAGAYGPVAVVENRVSGSRQILLNSRQRLSGTRRALASQRCQSWVPLLFCRNPERVATVGMAAGISAAAALDFPLKELHSIELVPEVVGAAQAQFSAWNAALFSDPRSHVYTADGRAKLAFHDMKAGRVIDVYTADGRAKLAQLKGGFDAIICDLFFPGEEGTANLYSREFFDLCRRRLNAGGVFCLWLPCYQHTPETAGMVIRTFTEVFPCAVALRANTDPLQPVIGLLGANAPLPMSKAFLTAQLGSPAGKRLAAQSPFFRSADTALLLFVADLHSASPGFGEFPVTTDDRPLFAFLGPRQPRGKERLYGFPLLEWMGKRALRPVYPSCDLGGMPPDLLLAAIRAGNYTYAAAAADVLLPGDPRSSEVRQRQVEGYLRQAAAICPAAAIPLADWTGLETSQPPAERE